MVPRTVQMAQEVAAQFTSPQLEAYGNIILNGYLSVVPNTINKKAWQYKETATAPVDLPSLSTVRPILRGWTTNYMEYYTQLPPNGYTVNPGDPTMFEYTVHSFTAAQGPITAIGNFQYGSGYPGGTFTNVPTTGGRGTGATLDVTCDPFTGVVTSVALNAPGTGYAVGDGLTLVLGGGTNFVAFVTSITTVSPAGQPKWAQPPHRYYQNQVASFTPPTANQKAIQYSFIYPVSDNLVAPPVDII